MFCDSTRISARYRPIGIVRNSDASRFQLPGPRNWLRPLLPQTAPTGCANAAGLIHCSFGPAEPYPIDVSPTTSIVWVPPDCCRPPLVPPIVNGLPDSHDAMPLTCQSLTTYAIGDVLVFMNGIS